MSTLQFSSLCYLAAWDRGLPVNGGLAFEQQLRQYRLDYSWSSLDRIDAFLDALRGQSKPDPELFLADQANINLLYFLAFYVGEVRYRVTGIAPQWLSYDEALAQDKSVEMYGRGIHSSLILHQGVEFLPLVSICVRLFEDHPDKSVAFSAGIGDVGPAGDPNAPLPPPRPRSLVKGFPARLAKLPSADLKRIITGIRHSVGRMPETDELSRIARDLPTLMTSGRVVWCAVVQANNQLFDPNFLGIAPGEVLYDPYGEVPVAQLHELAQVLFSLRQETSIQNAALRQYANHLNAETTRLFGWISPPELCPYPLVASSTLFQVESMFPGYVIANPIFPILISDKCPGSVIVAPWQLWPQDVFDHWNAVLKAKFGAQARIHHQPDSAVP